VANPDISERYKVVEYEMIVSRESSEYVRTQIAQVEAERRLKQLTKLSADWDSYGSDPPSPTALALAGSITEAFINFGLIPDAITPSAEGGVAMCFIRDGKYADVECFNSGEVLAVRYSSQDDPRAWTVPLNKVARDATIQDFDISFLLDRSECIVWGVL
jgi:hypothetical protein